MKEVKFRRWANLPGATEPLCGVALADAPKTKFVNVPCTIDCSNVDYCILFSSASVDGVTYFQCPKSECCDKEHLSKLQENLTHRKG